VIRRRDLLAGAAGLLAAGCSSGDGSGSAAALTTAPPATGRTDVPEPAVAPSPTASPAGTVVPVAGAPEGLAVDAADGLVAVGVRGPDGVALVDLATGKVRKLVPLTGAPRHLAMAGASGPLLVPSEQNDTLYQIALPGGTVTSATLVGRQPHDAAAIGSTVFVGNELANTVSIIRNGVQTAVVPGPLQPGGVAASADGSAVVVVGVRGRQITAYDATGVQLGSAPCGVGPTHVVAGAAKVFYVADTEGDAVLIYRAGTSGPEQVGRIATAGGAPYGMAFDAARGLLYVTLTADNLLQSFRVDASTGGGTRPASLVANRQWPTVRQPNSVAVDPRDGRAIVAGTAVSRLQFIDTQAAVS
jgi:DNA-binding beta-propeller fold protein YncE